MATQSLCREQLGLALVLACLVLTPQLVCAQEEDVGAPASQAAAIKGSMFSPAMQWVSQSKRGELLTTFNYRQAFDSNLVATSKDSLSGTYSYLEASWRYAHRSPGRTWQLSYKLGGRIYSPRFSDLNRAANDIEFQVQQRFTPRFRVTAFERWAKLPSTGFEEPSSDQTFPMMNSEEETVGFLAREKQTSESALILEYQASARTSVTWGGNFRDLKYTPQSILHSRTTDAYLSVNHRFSGRQSAGLGYLTQWISYPGQGSDARVDNILLTYSNQLRPTLEVSLFVGPAAVRETFASSPGGGVSVGDRQTLVGGLTANKRLGENHLTVKYNRTYARGSAFVGTALRQSVSLSFSRHMSHRFSLILSGSYAQSDLAGFSGYGYSSYRIQPSVRYRAHRSIWLTFSDAFASAFRGTAIGQLDRNVLSFGLEYRLPDLAVER